KVTDMAGKIVLQHKAAGGTEQMSIDKLTTGTYIVEIIDSKGNRTTEKLIKN
ncbi:MAG: T9SS type A sorting domain-containing protein, partial [Chitinophagaceae bacterium]|nr:T9SS type A sorting domain-containing protein [Chitinophagaceae bacterium]